MEGIGPLADFFKAIKKDGRISITHIGIYAALLQYWQSHDCENPLNVSSAQVMDLAKISSPHTYRRCMKSLHDFGYIRYAPSFKRNERSKVYLLLGTQ